MGGNSANDGATCSKDTSLSDSDAQIEERPGTSRNTMGSRSTVVKLEVLEPVKESESEEIQSVQQTDGIGQQDTSDQQVENHQPQEPKEHSNLISEDDSSSEDLEVGQVSSNNPSVPKVLEEVDLLSSEEEARSNPPVDLPYRFRSRKRNVYVENSSSSEEEESPLKKPKASISKQKKKLPFELTSLSSDCLQKYTNNSTRFPRSKSEWSFNSSQLKAKALSPKFGPFFKKCAASMQQFIYVGSCNNNNKDQNYPFLKQLLQSSKNLEKIIINYISPDEIIEILEIVKSCQKSLTCLDTLKLHSILGPGSIPGKVLLSLVETSISWKSLEIGSFLWSDAGPGPLEKLLEKVSSSLTSLIIHGGFKGSEDKCKFTVRLPKLQNLQNLSICPHYSFISERKNPLSKKCREVRLDRMENTEEPFKFSIKFTSELVSLRTLVLGNLVEIEDDLPFVYLKNLKTFRCGSSWHLSIRFPREEEGQGRRLKGSKITTLQFPDGLKDPSFPPRVRKFFPNVKRVDLALPSVPVLRSFFASFGDSGVDEVRLKTQFDFESLMESCLLPGDAEALRKSDLTKTQVETLKEYKWFEDYVKYHNVELPPEPEDLMEGSSAGIRALKCLKRLHLEHIPRQLLIPNPEEERKWFDHNCKFLSQTFGYEIYPMSAKCHREIGMLNLDEFTWKNYEVRSLRGFDRSNGYQVLNADQIGNDIEADELEDLFSPIGRGNSSRAQVAIQPSMLQPDYFKNKMEQSQ